MKILVVGLTANGAEGLSPTLRTRVEQADLLVGGRRQLAYFPDFQGETITLVGFNMAQLAARLEQARQAGQRSVVLASGDPLCYGIAASLRRYLPAERLEIIPAPSAFQLAFAALGEPWSDAALLSVHGRPLPAVIPTVLAHPKAAILTDSQNSPAALAEALLEAGLSPETACAICENLGGPTERVIRTTLGDVQTISHSPLNLFVVWAGGKIKPLPPQGGGWEGGETSPLEGSSTPRHQWHNRQCDPSTGSGYGITGSLLARSCTSFPSEERRDSANAKPSPIKPGLADAAFSTMNSQLTKREIRLLALAELALQPHEIMWDIGAGSGAVGLEAARMQPTAQVYAIEKRPEMLAHLRENLRRFPAPNLQWQLGLAPADIADWPQPHVVFIGGSGGQLPQLLKLLRERLRPGGRLVINLATLDRLQMVQTLLPGSRLCQLQISRAVPIQSMQRLQALNPIFMITWTRP